MNSALRNFRHRAGFTLVEIMVAIGIFSMVMVAIYSSWHMIVTGRDQGIKAAAEAQRNRMALRTIEAALFGARMSQLNAHFHAFIADTSDPDFAVLSFVSHLPRSFPGSGFFGNQPLRRVTFLAEPDPGGQARLVMLQSPMLQPDDGFEEPIPIVLARNLAAFSLEFWDEQNQTYTDEWLYTNQLPRQINVALATHGSTGPQDIQSVDMRTITIPSTTIPPTWQVPTAAETQGRGRNRDNDGGQPPEGPDSQNPNPNPNANPLDQLRGGSRGRPPQSDGLRPGPGRQRIGGRGLPNRRPPN